MSVYLVGAGPGALDLMTVRAARLVAMADVVVYDRLISPDVLALARPDAIMVDVGKGPGDGANQDSINMTLVAYARRFEAVVRLKGGDPFVFGRGGEEWLALRAAGLFAEVVPGVSSALAGPLAAGVPVTHRGLSRGVAIITGHGADDEAIDLAGLGRSDLTLVILMGVAQRARLAHDLIRDGRPATTPVAVIERAWTPSQRTVRSSLASLGTLRVHAPAVIVVGEVAALNLTDVLDEARSSVA
ncbi:MAG TPA: uroporphyrinogen-III C-methyltransferase [Acidimicrobiales bacterium]|nr:uroporphyrinogen-III C-methyltransferase [Acidimicrobiales bacterium]